MMCNEYIVTQVNIFMNILNTNTLNRESKINYICLFT
jgi:hypothetical protein